MIEKFKDWKLKNLQGDQYLPLSPIDRKTAKSIKRTLNLEQFYVYSSYT